MKLFKFKQGNMKMERANEQEPDEVDRLLTSQRIARVGQEAIQAWLINAQSDSMRLGTSDGFRAVVAGI